MRIPNSLGNFAWGSKFPACLLWDTKNTEGVPKSLGDLTRGYQILGGAGSPMTPAPLPAATSVFATCKVATGNGQESRLRNLCGQWSSCGKLAVKLSTIGSQL